MSRCPEPRAPARRWRGAAAVLAAASALALLAVPSSGSAVDRSRCPRGGHTIAANDHARVWRVSAGDRADRHFGCAFRSGRVTRLDPRGGQMLSAGGSTRLVGTTVAFETSYDDLRPYQVVVRSLRTGRTIHRATSNAEGTNEGDTSPASRIVLKNDGSVAWTASVDCAGELCPDPAQRGWEVHALARGERRRVLDAGPEVDPDSLRLVNRGRELRWRRGGETRSAPFD